MKPSYLSNSRLYLRAVEPEDLAVLYDMENAPESWDVSNFIVPYSRYVLKQYIEQSQSDMFADRQLRLMIVRRDDDAVMGTLDITDFVPLHGHGEVGIAMQAAYRGQGYASDALRLLCEYAFGFLHLKQLTAHVAADNEASIRLFTACGFQTCGCLKQWWRVGREYKDVLLLQHIRPD